MPRERLVFDAGERGEDAAAEGCGFRPGAALEAGFLAWECVAEGGADGLVDAAVYAARESCLGQVAVVDVAGEDEDCGGWAASLSGGYCPYQVDHRGERVVEGGSVVEVLGATEVLGPRGGAGSPGAAAKPLGSGLEVVHTGTEEQGERAAEEEEVEATGRFVLDPAPLARVHHGAALLFEDPAAATFAPRWTSRSARAGGSRGCGRG
jgi:hypothetical protein